jgi:hypothetical protein
MLLRGLALAPFLWQVPTPRAESKDYSGPAEVLDAIDSLEADVAGRLEAIAATLASARPLATSFLADHARHRHVRATMRERLRLAGPPKPGPSKGERGLDGLRAAQEALVYAHAEGLPALGDASAVDALARNMIDLARHLAVIDLWLEAEAARD